MERVQFLSILKHKNKVKVPQNYVIFVFISILRLPVMSTYYVITTHNVHIIANELDIEFQILYS
jgi:lipid-A-disaccharide synthase-like uncharacterized protein